MKYALARGPGAGGKTINTVSPSDMAPARVPSPNGAYSKVQLGAKSTPLSRKSVETPATPPARPKAPPVSDDVSTLFNWPSDILIETLDVNRLKIPLRDLAIVASLVHTHDNPYKYLKNSPTWFSDFIIQVLSRASNQKVIREMNGVNELENPNWTAEELSHDGTFGKVPIYTRRKDHIQFLLTAFEARRTQITQRMKDADAIVADKRSREQLQEAKRQDTLDIARAEEFRAKTEAATVKVDTEEARLRDTMAKLEAETTRLNETTAKANAAASRLKRLKEEIERLK